MLDKSKKNSFFIQNPGASIQNHVLINVNDLAFQKVDITSEIFAHKDF
jgi:hypothetical protein